MSNFWKNKKILITGADGFIGSHLAEKLIDLGALLTIVVRATSNHGTSSYHFKNLSNKYVKKCKKIVCCDISSTDIIRHIVKDNPRIIFHLAANAYVPYSFEHPLEVNEANVVGTLNLLNASINASVRRLVFASSSSVYGANKRLPKREDMLPEPISPYAVSKLAGEKYCLAFSHVYGLDTVCLRYFNVFGPRQDPTSAYAAFIPIFLDGLLRGKKLTVNGDGSISRDFTHVKNVVTANLRAIQSADVGGRVFNVACGNSVTLIEIIKRMRELTGLAGDVKHGPLRAGDVLQSLADISAARKKLGYEPEVSVWDGLEDTVAWFQSKLPN